MVEDKGTADSSERFGQMIDGSEPQTSFFLAVPWANVIKADIVATAL